MVGGNRGRVRVGVLVALWLMAAAAAMAAPVDVAAHGKRTTLENGGAHLTALYLRGTPYEMGYAHGALCREEVSYLARRVAPLMLMGLGKTAAEMDEIWAGYEKHISPDYVEELRGLADGSGVPLADLKRFTAIPDVSEWHCTFFAAAGGSAAAKDLVQIRALDYNTRAGIQTYPALIVYRPTKGVPFVNVGWLGHCGLVTGMNAAGIAMSEIGDDWDQATDSFDGRPLNFVMRDTLQFSRTLGEALGRVKDGPRTTSLLYCLSSAKENQVRALRTSHAKCEVFTSSTLPYKSKPGLVYLSMGMDSKWNPKVGAWLLERYGSLDVEKAQEMMRELHTGGLHAVVMKPGAGELWVANATATEMGYTQPYIHFSLKSALADPFFK